MRSALDCRTKARGGALLGALLAGIVLCIAAFGQGGEKSAPVGAEDADACLACHSSDATPHPPIDGAALQASPHAGLKCQGCHSSVTGVPHTAEMTKDKPSCGMCHPEVLAKYSASVHARSDKVAGDHPTCISCHSTAGNAHAIAKTKLSKTQKVGMCSRCHADAARMRRYGVDPDAVSSYEHSFHGKALVRYGLDRAAACTDCHLNHDVMAPSDPKSTTNRANVAATCGQAKCHPGAAMNFAMSGASHLKLKMKQSPVLHLEELFFQWLTLGTMVFLLGGVALDLRHKVFSKHAAPGSGRAVAAFIGASFIVLVATLAMAFLDIGGRRWTAAASLVLMLIAFVIYWRRPKKTTAGEGTYVRLSVGQRLQHFLLMLSFTLLVLTGLPLRFPGVEWLNVLYGLFGGITSARIIHRVAAVVMIATWVSHTFYLLVRWKQAGFKLSSMTMFPTLKDVRDFVDLSKYYFGLAPHPPKYDRFGFKEKFDYFAVYWGMPVMVFSGLVLWFPIFFGNRLPELGLGVAYIAHSDEAILAFLAILMWHLYNAHFNPDSFPMSKAWLTGVKTESEMAHEHPLELERLKK